MKTNKLLYIIGTALLMAGCSAEKDAEQTNDGRVPINLSYSVQQAQLTRTNNATINDLYIAPGGQVHVNIIKNGTSDIIYDNNYYVTEASTATINTVENTPVSTMAPMSGVPCYPADGTGVDIKAYYPAIASTGSFSVRTDQSTDEGYAGSDLMWATPLTNQKVSDNPVNLNFTHQMAKIVLKINKGTGVSTVNSVKLTNVNPNVTFTTSDGTTTLSGTATTNILVSSGDLTATDEIAAIIPAQTIAGEFIVVSTNSGNATFSIASKAFDANTKYSATLNLASSNIGATNTITTWDEKDFSAPGTFPAQSLGELTNIINSGGAYSDYLGKYVDANGKIQSSSTGAVGTITTMNTTDVDADLPGSRIIVTNLAGNQTATYGVNISETTALHVGKPIANDGMVYKNKADITFFGKTAIAMIIYVGAPGTADTSSPHYKGLAVALADASNGAQWDTVESSEACVIAGKWEEYWDAATETFGLLDGIKNTYLLSTDSHTHPAATSAKNYSSMVPSGTSGWFLPSVSQYNMLYLSAGVAMNKWDPAWGWCPDSNGEVTNRGQNYLAVQNMFTAVGLTEAVFVESPYWTSSCVNNDSPIYTQFSSTSGVHISNNPKTNSFRVRSFLAF